MSKGAAYAVCALTALAILAADYIVVTSSWFLSPLAERELSGVFGDQLTFTSVEAGWFGGVRLQGVGFQVAGGRHHLFSADRVTVSAKRWTPLWVDQITLDEPRIRVSDRLLDDMAAESGGRPPLRKLVQPELLPRIVCRGGTFELFHSDVLKEGGWQAFRIEELALVPATGYLVYLGGRVRSSLWGEWKIQGEIDLDSGEHRLTLSTDSVVLGADVRKALAPDVQAQWDRYAPQGRAAAILHLEHDASRGDAGERFRLTLKPVDMRLTYVNFPYPCEKIAGEIEFRADGFTVKNLSARHGERTRIRFDGEADGYDAAAGYQFRVEMDRVPLDETLRGALSENARNIWKLFEPGGDVDARATVMRDRGRDTEARIPVDLTFRNASFRYERFPYAVSRVTGEMRIEDGDVEVKRLRGFHGRTEFLFSGRVDSIGEDPNIDGLEIRIRALDVEDPQLRAVLPQELRRVRDAFTPSGSIDLDLRVFRAPGQEPRFHAHARLKENRVLYKEVGLPVTVMEGDVEYDGRTVHVNHVRGRLEGDARVELRGTVDTSESGRTHLELDAHRVRIDDAFKRAMPLPLWEILSSLKFSAESAQFKLTLDMEPQGDIGVALELIVEKGRIDTDLRVEDIQGTLHLSGMIVDGKPRFSGGRFAARSARLMDYQIQYLTTDLSVLDSLVIFNNLHGGVYNGTLSGGFQIDTRTNDLRGEFRVDDLELEKFIQDTRFANREIRGKVRLTLDNLQGRANDPATLQGKGSLFITEGSLIDVPGIVVFLNPFKLGRKFTAAKALFEIRDRRFHISSFAFYGEEGSGSVYGEGYFGFDGRYRLKVGTETASTFGLNFFLTDLPIKIIDWLKPQHLKRYAGTLDEAFEEPLKE